ncbi:MAG: hypothetical protein Q8Q52_02120, partial [Acidimicrobiia bacterium]|nr:hypothetical protein [Acidimicrobiia bacterium]
LDLAVWVVDPEKYRDRVLHDELLRPLAGHQAIFRFVLNQIDRLGASDLSLLMADLERALRADGIAYPTVWPAAADPPIGPPIGIDEVWEGIVEALGSGSQRSDYLVVELRRGASMLAPHVVETGFGWRWERTREQVADLIGAGQMLASEVALRGLVAEVAPDAGDLGIGEVLQSATAVDDRAHHLDVTLGRRIRDLLRPKAHTRALLNELQLALASAVQGS